MQFLGIILGVIAGLVLAVLILGTIASLGWNLLTPATGADAVGIGPGVGAVLLAWAIGAAAGISNKVAVQKGGREL